MLRKKMKGDYEIVNFVIGGIIFTVAIAIFFSFVLAEVLNLEAKMASTENDLQAVDAAHLVKKCLQKGQDTISAELLKESNGGDLGKVCPEAGSIKAEVSIETFEDPENSKYTLKSVGLLDKANPLIKVSEHKIFVNVKKAGKNYVSRFQLSLYGKKPKEPTQPAAKQPEEPQLPGTGEVTTIEGGTTKQNQILTIDLHKCLSESTYTGPTKFAIETQSDPDIKCSIEERALNLKYLNCRSEIANDYSITIRVTKPVSDPKEKDFLLNCIVKIHVKSTEDW